MEETKELKKTFPFKPVIITLVASCFGFAFIAGLGIKWYQDMYYDQYNMLPPFLGGQVITITTTQTVTGTPVVLPTDTVIPTPSLKEFHITPISTVESFKMEDLLTNDRNKALQNITKAFNNVQAVDSVGYKMHASDGEEFEVDYYAKFEKSEKDMLIYHRFENINYYESYSPYYVPYQVGTSQYYGGYSDVNELNGSFISVVFTSECGELQCSIYNNDNYGYSYHLQEEMPSYSFTSKEITLSGNKKGVEYLFTNDSEEAGLAHYLIWISEDGLIYLLQTPKAYLYTEYADIEYNVKYNIEFSSLRGEYKYLFNDD